MMKKPLLKELSVSDIVVALINQEHTEDRTPLLKDYLYKTVRQVQEDEKVAEQLILLPEFALQEMQEQQLFDYHLQRNNWSGDQCSNFQSLLESVNERRKRIIDNSSSTFQRSQLIMNELIQKLGQSYTYLHDNRQPLHKLAKHLQDQYLSILRKIGKIQNMQKAADVMKMWNRSNISKVLSIKPQNILQHMIEDIFRSFEEIGRFLHDNKDQLISYGNLVSLLNDRKKAIIAEVCSSMAKSIREFTEEAQYAVKYDQYCFILQSDSLTAEERKLVGSVSILKQENLCTIVDKDIQQIYFSTISPKGMNYNLQLLNQNAFVDFFSELMEEFNHYFSSWHKVTTFHLQRETVYKEGFIKHRTVVFQRMLERIAQSLKFSNKFSYISLAKQLELFQKIQDFVDCGEQWMGKCKSSISSVLLDKYKGQTETFFKVNNGDLKSALFQEFSINASEDKVKEDDRHIKENQRLKLKLRLVDEMQVQVKQFTRLNLDYAKIGRLLYDKEGAARAQNACSCPLTQQALQQEIKTYYEQLNTKLGFTLFKNIVQYQLRQAYLPDSTQLQLIYQHIQFIIFIVYKVCIPNYMKRQIQKEIFNDLERDQRLSAVKVAISKNMIEESTFTTINQLRHIFLERNSFGDLYDFLQRVGSRFQGTTIATYINTTLYFQDYEKYEGEVKSLHEKLLTVLNELYLLTQYLQKCIEMNRFYKANESLYKDILSFKQVLPALVLVYFTAYFQNSSHKYYKYVLPLFMSLKFEVKKLAADTLVPFKQYRAKIHEIYRQNSIVKYTQPTCFHQMLFLKQVQYFYKFLIDLFSKIEKINDNGRQILKSQQLEFSRLVGLERSFNNGQNWQCYLQAYIQSSRQRNQNLVLQKAGKFVLQFPIQWWKSNLVWIYYDSSSKQKKEYLFKLLSTYYNRICSLPRI